MVFESFPVAGYPTTGVSARRGIAARHVPSISISQGAGVSIRGMPSFQIASPKRFQLAAEQQTGIQEPYGHLKATCWQFFGGAYRAGVGDRTSPGSAFGGDMRSDTIEFNSYKQAADPAFDFLCDRFDRITLFPPVIV